MLSRRHFVLKSGLALSSLAWPPSTVRAAAGLAPLSNNRRQWLLDVLPPEDQRFDPLAKMLVVSTASEPLRHATGRTGDVHGTDRSLHYASALLDAGEKWRTERAQEILRVVLSMQDTEPSSSTYGCWPWSLEEPLAKQAPDDISSAAFCAVPLFMAWLGHRDSLGGTLEASTREAILHAARSILNRELDPGKTAQAIAGTEVALLAVQEFKVVELRPSAKERLKQLSDSILRQGSLAEYNSPVLTVDALQELSRMLWLVKDSRDRALIRELHDLAWKHTAAHFHPPTQQWAGPHRYSIETDLRKNPVTLAFLQTAGADKVRFQLRDPLPLSLAAYRIPLQCPRQSVKQFVRLDKAREVVETFARSQPGKPGSIVPVVGTTWLHPRFTLGSINRGDFAMESRPLLGYWGSPSAPRSLRVRFLKDHQDFASAQLFSVQHEGSLLAAVGFATDSGEAVNGVIRARDLRLRFEFGGTTDGLAVKSGDAPQKHFVMQDRDLRWLLRPIDDAFGKERLAWETQPEFKLVNQIDAVAYHGEEREFPLAELGEAFACFTMQEWPYDEKVLPRLELARQRANGRLHVRWSLGRRTLDLQTPTKPAPRAILNDSFRGVRA